MNPDIESALKPLLEHAENSTGSEYSLTFPADFPAFQGHFPGYPILPGVVLITSARLLLEKKWNQKLFIEELRRVKFFRPVRPGETVCVKLESTPELAANIHISIGTDKVSSFTMQLKGKK